MGSLVETFHNSIASFADTETKYSPYEENNTLKTLSKFISLI